MSDFSNFLSPGRKGHLVGIGGVSMSSLAEVLHGSFRSVDDICRIREDEFVVIMTRMTSAMRALVFDKVEQVNAVLQEPEGDVGPLSLSVGVACSDREKPEGDIFQDADTALMRMKQVRHCGCAVY